MKKKVLSMILAFAMILVQIPSSVYVLAADRDSGLDSSVVDSAGEASSTGWTIDDVLDLIDALPQADEIADESKVEVKIALNEALAAYSAAMEQADIDAQELRDAVGDERRDKLRALSDLLSDVDIPVLDSGSEKSEPLSVYSWRVFPEYLDSSEMPITEQDGSYRLDLSEKASDTPLTEDELTAMLPGEIIVIAGEDRSEETASVLWNCDSYVQDEDGNWPSFGEYIFGGTLSDEFALDEAAAPVEITVILLKVPLRLLTSSPTQLLDAALYAENSEVRQEATYRGDFVVDEDFGGISAQDVVAPGAQNAIRVFSVNIPVPDDAWYDFSFEEFISRGSDQTAYGGYFVNAPDNGWQRFWCGFDVASIDMSQYTYERVYPKNFDNGGTAYSPSTVYVKGGAVLLPYIMQPDFTGQQNSDTYNKFKIKDVQLTKLRNQLTVATNTGTGIGTVDVAVTGEESLNSLGATAYDQQVGRGAEVTLTANPAAGSYFDHWVGTNDSDLGREATITIATASGSADESAKAYKAVFISGEDSRVSKLRDDSSRNELTADDIHVTYMGQRWSESENPAGLRSNLYYSQLGSRDAQLTLDINITNANTTLYGLLTNFGLGSITAATKDVPVKITVDGQETNVVLQSGKSHTAFYIDGLSAGHHTVTFEATAEEASVYLHNVGAVSESNQSITLKAADFADIAGCESYTILVDGEDVTANIMSATGITAPYGSVVELMAVNADVTRYTFQKWDTGAYTDTPIMHFPNTMAAENKGLIIARGDMTLTPVYDAGIDINSAILQTLGEKDPNGNDYDWRMNNSSKFSVDADGNVAIKAGGELTLNLTIPAGKAYMPHIYGAGMQQAKLKLLTSGGSVLKEQYLSPKDNLLVLTEGSYQLVFSNPSTLESSIVKIKNFSCPEYGTLEVGRVNITADQTTMSGVVSDATALVKDAVTAPDYIFLGFMGTGIELIYVPESYTQKVFGQSYLSDPVRQLSLDKAVLLAKDLSPINATGVGGDPHSFTESAGKLLLDINSDFYVTDNGGYDIKLNLSDVTGSPYMVGSTLYANGRTLYVDAANKVWFYEGNVKGDAVRNMQENGQPQITLADNATIYGGSNKSDVESASLTIDSASGATTGLTIVGGGNGYGVTGDVKVTVNGRKVASILGGNAGAGTKPNSIMVDIAGFSGTLEATGGITGGAAIGRVYVQSSIPINGNVTGGSSEKTNVMLVLNASVMGSVTGVPENGSAKGVTVTARNSVGSIVGADKNSTVIGKAIVKLLDYGYTAGEVYGAREANITGDVQVDYLSNSASGSTIYGQKDSTVGGNVTVNLTPGNGSGLYGSSGGSVGGSVSVKASNGKLISDYADSVRAVSGGTVNGNVTFNLTGGTTYTSGKTLYAADANAQLKQNLILQLNAATDNLKIIDAHDSVAIVGKTIADIYQDSTSSSLQAGGQSADSQLVLHTVYTQPVYIKQGQAAPALDASLQLQAAVVKMTSDREGYDKYATIVLSQPYVNAEAKAIYANGYPVEVKTDGIYYNNTSLIGDYSGYTLYGGKEFEAATSSSITVTGVGYPLTIFGAGKNSAVGTVNLSINAIIDTTTIYGGAENANMPATSQVNLSITGSSASAGNVFAGCKNGDFAGKVSLDLHKNLRTTDSNVGNVSWSGAIYACSENGNFSGEATIATGAENYLFKVDGGIWDTYQSTGTNSGKFHVELYTDTDTEIHCPAGSDAQAMNGSIKNVSIENGVVAVEPEMTVNYSGIFSQVYTNGVPILQAGDNLYIDKGTLGVLDDADALVRGLNYNYNLGKLQIHLGKNDGNSVSSATANLMSGNRTYGILVEAVTDDVNILVNADSARGNFHILFNKNANKPTNFHLTLGLPGVWGGDKITVNNPISEDYTGSDYIRQLPLTKLTANCLIGIDNDGYGLSADKGTFEQELNLDTTRYELNGYNTGAYGYLFRTREKSTIQLPILGTLPAEAVATVTPSDGSWVKNAELIAPAGYLISLAADGVYQPNIVYNNSNILPQSVTYYIKGSDSTKLDTYNKYAPRITELKVYTSDAKITDNPTDISYQIRSTELDVKFKLPFKNTDTTACGIGKVYVYAKACSSNTSTWDEEFLVKRATVLSDGIEIMTRDAEGYWNATITNLVPNQKYWVYAAFITESGVICKAFDDDPDSWYPMACPLSSSVDNYITTPHATLEMKEAPTISIPYAKDMKFSNATFTGGKVVLEGSETEIPGSWRTFKILQLSWGVTGPFEYEFWSDINSQYYTLLKKNLTITITPKQVTAELSGTPTAIYGSDGVTTATFTIPTTELVNAGDDVSVTATVTLPTDAVGTYIDALSVGTPSNSGTMADAYIVTLPEYIMGTILPRDVTRTESEAHNTQAYSFIGEFTSPEFTGVGTEKITGTFRYTYGGVFNGTYAQVVKEVAKSAPGTTANVSYTFTAAGNYTGIITGTIAIAMNNPPVTTEEGALTVKSTPVFGDSWNDIFTLDSSKVYMMLGSEKVAGICFLQIEGSTVTGSVRPNAGSYAYQVLFSSNDGRFIDIPVAGLAGNVTVDKKTLAESMLSITGTYTYTGSKIEPAFTVTDGTPSLIKESDYTVSYDENTDAGENAGSVTVRAADIGNYSGEAEKRFTIAPKAVTASGTAEKVYDGNLGADSALTFIVSGLNSRDTVTLVTSGSVYDTADAGNNRTVTVGTVIKTGEGSQNYTVEVPETVQNAVISKRPVAVTVDVGQGKSYGQCDPSALTYAAAPVAGEPASGLVNGDTLSGDLARQAGEYPTMYTVERGTLTDAANLNYAIAFNNSNRFIIRPASVALNISVSPSSQKVNKTAILTVSAQNAGTNLMNSGWSQPVGLSLNGPNGMIPLLPVVDQPGTYTATYNAPDTVPNPAELTFTASVNDPSGCYLAPSNKTAVLTIIPRGAVTVTVSPDKETGVTYGDNITYTAYVAKANATDTDTLTGTVQFYLDGNDESNKVGVAQDISATTQVTLNRTQLTMGSHIVYAVYSGNTFFTESSASASTEVAQAKPTITWAAAAQSVTYTALEPIIAAPTVTLLGEDVYSGSFEYSYKADASGTVYTNGLPTAVGTYYVKAHIDADDYTNYSGADSDSDLTLTIAYLQTDAVAIADGTQGENGWFTSNVTLKAPEGYSIATANGSDAVWGSNLTPINIDTSSDYTYYLKNGNGEITDAKTISVNQDTAAPVIGTVVYSVHQSFLDWIFHKSKIQVTVPVTDNLSGADHISYVLAPSDGSMPQAAQTAAVDSEGNAVFDVDKTFIGTVYVTAYDKAGNASASTESKRMAVEETAPTLSLTKDGTNAFTENWYTSQQTLNIIAEDMGSGIQSLTYAVDGGDATTLFEAKETYADITPSLVELVSVREGVHTYTVTVTDNALNTIEQTVTIKQDTVAPTVSSVTPSHITDTALTLTAEASDGTSGSGVKQYYLAYEAGDVSYPDLDKATCKTSTNGIFELTSLTRNTTYTISIWAEDIVGNISDPNQSRTKTAKTSLEGATVTLGSSSFTYDGQSHTPSAITVTLGGETLTAGTDYTVSYSNSNGGENNTINVGTVTVTLTAVESGNYTGAVSQTTGMTYQINPTTPTMAWSETDKAQTVTYTGSPAIITAPQVTLVNSETYIGNIQYAYKKVDGFMNGLFAGYTNGLPTDAGKYLVKAHIVANGNYTAADSTNELELIIDKADATLSIKNTYTGKTYDGTPMVDPTAAQIESNITNPAVVYAYYADNSGVKGSHLSSTPVNAGTYWVEGSIAEANNTKAVTSAAVKFTIAKAPLTINGGTVAPKKWDNQATAPVESITFSGLQNSESLAFGTDYTVTGAAYEDAAVGSVKIVISGTVELKTTGTAANYTLFDTALYGKGLKGTIIKADGPTAPTFNAWDDAANTFTFNSTNGTIYEYRINSTDENGWTSVTASGGTTVISVGNVAIPVGGLEMRVKTTDTHEAGAILTNTSEQVFTASIEGGVSIDKTTGVTYGDILTATASGYQTGANLHYQWTADGSNVGTDSATYTVQSADIDKAITATVTATGYNGSLTPATATNKVLKRAITVTADAKSKTYGQVDPDFTYSITAGSLINSDTLAGALNRNPGETPNTYTINQGTLDNAAYIITYENADLTINKVDVTLNVTVNPAAAKAGKTVTVTVSAINAGSNLAGSGWNQPAGVTLLDPNSSGMTLKPVAGKSGEYTASYQIPAETAENTQLTFTAAVADITGNYTNPQSKNATLTVTHKSAVKLTVTADKTSGVTYGDSVVYTAKVEKENPVVDLLNKLDGTVVFYLDEIKVDNLLATKTIGTDMLSVALDSTKLTAGEHTVYAVYSGNAEFAEAAQNMTTTVAAKSLTWDVSGLSALKKYDGNDTATISGTLLVTGVLEGTDPGFSYTNLLGAYADVVAGSQTVTVTVNGAALANINYALPVGNPIFTGKINAVDEIINVPESGNGTDYKLEQEFGISGVPNGLASDPGLNTPAKIEARMKVSIENAMNGVETTNIEIYDITLLFSTDNNQTWQTATESTFPTEGVTIILPYPSGTNRDNFDFVITHMFTTGANAGTTETIIPTKMAEGLKFTLHSLSPVAVGYKAATSNGSSGGSGDSEDSIDYNAEFWKTVENKINTANSGDVIKVDAKFFDKMTCTVMDSLRKNDITLVIDWSNGNTITIPAGKAQQNELGRIYWPLSKLAELYDDVTFVEEADLEQTYVNPETGGVGYIVYANTGETVPITGSVQKVEVPVAQEQNVEAPMQMTATPSTEGMTAIPARNFAGTIASVLALFAAVFGGCWGYRRRKVTNK